MKYFKSLMFLNIVICLFNTSSFANSNGEVLSEGIIAFKNEQYKESFAILKPLAKSGSSIAQFYMGLMYGKGKGVKHDVKEAVRLFKLSSRQDNSDAQYYLGMAYANGYRIKEDLPLAHMWLSFSSKKNAQAKQAIYALEKMMSKNQKEKAIKLYQECNEKKIDRC